jgi:hypothetical protein
MRERESEISSAVIVESNLIELILIESASAAAAE